MICQPRIKYIYFFNENIKKSARPHVISVITPHYHALYTWFRRENMESWQQLPKLLFTAHINNLQGW